MIVERVGWAVLLLAALLSYYACSQAPAEVPSQRTEAPPPRAEPTTDCAQIQCFRAVECVKKCGDTPQGFGCCPCPPGMLDVYSCSQQGR